MADGKQDLGVPPPRKRPAPTIDLKATEVASDPVTSAQETDPPSDTTTSEPKSTGAPEAPPRAAATPASPVLAWPLLAAGVAGGVVTLCVVSLFWLFVAPAQDDHASALDARLATFEQQIRDLAARPQPAASDPRALADLAASVSKLETIAAAPRPAAPRLGARHARRRAGIRAPSVRRSWVAHRCARRRAGRPRRPVHPPPSRARSRR